MLWLAEAGRNVRHNVQIVLRERHLETERMAEWVASDTEDVGPTRRRP